MSATRPIRAAVVGLGKMGLSHMALVNAHPDVSLDAVCDASGYVLGVLGKYTGVPTFTSYDRMLAEADLDAVFIATPSRSHAELVEKALDAGLHVFCEKPFTLEPARSAALAERAGALGRVTQVGYHNRFAAPFREVRRLLDAGAIGTVVQGLAEAYGPVVLKEKGSTWRSDRKEGGGCLYDYAAHAIDLLQWYLGEPEAVRGARLGQVFSRSIDDTVTGSILFAGDAVAQLSANWSDASQRRMKTAVRLWGHRRVDLRRPPGGPVFLREAPTGLEGYDEGWNVKYTTELTEPVWFYLRGEEYSAQVDTFFARIRAGEVDGEASFASAAVTDRIIGMVADDASGVPASGAAPGASQRRRRWRRG